MRIKRILEIKNLGVFSNFSWLSACQDFKQYNFFYGWNYSGKTTLSRLFKSLEDKKIHLDFPELSFKLQTDNGNLTEKNIGREFDIRVFNEEFVSENFRWNDNDFEINPVLILGKESIEFENSINKLKKEKEQTKKKKEQIEEKKKEKEKELNTKLTNAASKVRYTLGITNAKDFDKKVLEAKINEVKDTYKNQILKQDRYDLLLDIIRISANYETISEINIQLKLNDYKREAKKILVTQVKPQKINEDLKNDPELSNWVKEGIELYRNETRSRTVCLFCGNKLPNDLLDRLNKHFSKEYEEFMQRIEREKEEIAGHIEEIKELRLLDSNLLYPDCQDKYRNAKELFEKSKQDYVQMLKKLLSILDSKEEKPFEVLDFDEVSFGHNDLDEALMELNSTIKKHNFKVQNIEEEKKEAKEKLESHLIAMSIKDTDYFSLKKSIEEYEQKTNELNLEIEAIEDEIADVEKKIKAEAIGADKINLYLKGIFNENRLQLKLLEDGSYKIYREGEVAKNLSTGEKNIISLIYFFARLEERNFDLSQAIVFIDDPVSSLDSNHLFKVYGFLCERIENCGQLFITTHNFDFFNLLKDFNKFDLGNRGALFLLKRAFDNQGNSTSTIENLPKVLRDFKSEYNYLFSILKRFNESTDKTNFDLLYIIPNIARRFLEEYLFMRYPNGKKYKEKCDFFFKHVSTSSKKSALKLLDEYSHEESTEHAYKFPDINEVEPSVKFILDTLKSKDPEHYQALCDSLV